MNNVYSIAFPKQDSFPPRPFTDLGEDPVIRIDNAIKKWLDYTLGCLSVADTIKDRYLVVPYENMPEHIPRIEKMLGLKLKKRLPYKNRNVSESKLEQIQQCFSENPKANQVMDLVLNRKA